MRNSLQTEAQTNPPLPLSQTNKQDIFQVSVGIAKIVISYILWQTPPPSHTQICKFRWLSIDIAKIVILQVLFIIHSSPKSRSNHNKLYNSFVSSIEIA